MIHHNWKQYDTKKTWITNVGRMVAVLETYRCTRCGEISSALRHFLPNGDLWIDIQGNFVRYSLTWDGDCDLAIISKIHEL